jgi:hypothetical protein
VQELLELLLAVMLPLSVLRYPSCPSSSPRTSRGAVIELTSLSLSRLVRTHDLYVYWFTPPHCLTDFNFRQGGVTRSDDNPTHARARAHVNRK